MEQAKHLTGQRSRRHTQRFCSVCLTPAFSVFTLSHPSCRSQLSVSRLVLTVALSMDQHSLMVRVTSKLVTGRDEKYTNYGHLCCTVYLLLRRGMYLQPKQVIRWLSCTLYIVTSDNLWQVATCPSDNHSKLGKFHKP